MTFLFWGLLNIALFTLFIVLCFQATKLMKEKFGFTLAVVFVIGLLSFATRPNPGNANYRAIVTGANKWKFISPDKITPNTTQHLLLILKKTLIAKYNLGLVYGQDSASRTTVPINAYTTVSGTESGTTWIVQYISITTTGTDKKMKYFVQGIIEWKLLGTTVYSQPQTYTGIIEIK